MAISARAAGTEMALVHDIREWIDSNQKDFHPPVCNKCMYADQLKVFFVGGPNQRNDYHLEEGEELFYQVEGDMVLKVLEKGEKKDVHIRQGELFLLPARVEHSPQRFANTIGCVVERTRAEEELDCVRYFVGDSTERLYERWFHLEDVVKDLPPVITEFKASKECASGQPGPRSFLREAPFEPRLVTLMKPLNLAGFLEENLTRLREGPLQLFGAPEFSTEVFIYGPGDFSLSSGHVELLLWQEKGSSVVTTEDGRRENLGSFHLARVLPSQEVRVRVEEGVLLSVRMSP